eukprot:2680370-Prymnesium_polylepis.1
MPSGGVPIVVCGLSSRFPVRTVSVTLHHTDEAMCHVSKSCAVNLTTRVARAARRAPLAPTRRNAQA